MSGGTSEHSIVTQDEFEYKVLMRLRQCRKHGDRVLIDCDAEELQVLNRIESLRAKSMSASAPIASVVFND